MQLKTFYKFVNSEQIMVFSTQQNRRMEGVDFGKSKKVDKKKIEIGVLRISTSLLMWNTW